MKSEGALLDKIVSLCKRRGFVFPGSEIYGGLNGTWDYGPLGVGLKNNIKKLWWKSMIYDREDVFGIESSIIMNPKVWRASGHAEHFQDLMVECLDCKKRFRKEDINNKKCPECGGHLDLAARKFNTMFKTFVGPVEDSAGQTYLRPETAQGIFINFANILDTIHPKIPFGIAQIGKAFRNEITTGNFVFRSREFEQMELEYFVNPKEDERWHEYWRKERFNWYVNVLKIKRENIRLRDYKKEELAHYSKATTDVEYEWPFMGFGELEGIANRTDYDLKNHSKESGKELNYFNEEEKNKFIPYVIEPSAGVDRIFLALLFDAYEEEKIKDETRIVLRLNPKLAPYKVAVFPLVSNKSELIKKAKEIYQSLKKDFVVAWDERGNIGKRYRYQDEIGTPWCVTIDYETLENNTITIRDRDTMKQERKNIGELPEYFADKLLITNY